MARKVYFIDTAKPEIRGENIAFTAEVDGKPVMCLVGKATVLRQTGTEQAEGEELLKLFRWCRVKMQGIAASLVLAGRINADGQVQINDEDVPKAG